MVEEVALAAVDTVVEEVALAAVDTVVEEVALATVSKPPHQGCGLPSRKNLPVGPSGVRVVAHTTEAAPSGTGRAPIASTPGAVAVLMAHAQASDEFATTYRTLHEHWREPMLAAVRRGIQRSELHPDTDAHLVVDLLLGLQWSRLLVDHRRTTAADAEASVDTVLAGRLA